MLCFQDFVFLMLKTMEKMCSWIIGRLQKLFLTLHIFLDTFNWRTTSEEILWVRVTASNPRSWLSISSLFRFCRLYLTRKEFRTSLKMTNFWSPLWVCSWWESLGVMCWSYFLFRGTMVTSHDTTGFLTVNCFVAVYALWHYFYTARCHRLGVLNSLVFIFSDSKHVCWFEDRVSCRRQL